MGRLVPGRCGQPRARAMGALFCCDNDTQSCRKYMCCGRKLEHTSRAHFLEQAQTGDILLIDQRTLKSAWKCLTRSEFSHVAIVIDTPRGVKFLLEAVAPQTLAWRLDHAIDFWLSPEGEAKNVVWRKLTGVERTPRLIQRVFEFAMAMQGRPYESNYMEFLSAVLQQDARHFCRCCVHKDPGYKEVDGKLALKRSEEKSASMNMDKLVTDNDVVCDMMGGIDPETDKSTQKLFCSELAAFFYQQAGWMTKEQKPYHFLPKDFADYSNASADSMLKPGLSLSSMILVTDREEVSNLPTPPPPSPRRASMADEISKDQPQPIQTQQTHPAGNLVGMVDELEEIE